MATASADFESKMLPALPPAFSPLVCPLPPPRPARPSLAGFKIREGMILGMSATLRGKRMKHFLDRVINIALPRIRDFHGLRLKGIDQNGNLSFGVKEHVVFPEIILEESRVNFGLEITLPRPSLSKAANSKSSTVLLPNLAIAKLNCP